MTRVRAHDQGFVAAPPGAVYRLVADVASYPRWWRSVAAGVDGAPALRLERRRAAEARPDGHRDGVGLFVHLGPPYRGTLEWYLEPFEDGTIVNALLDVELPGGGRGRRRLRRMRASLRRGLVGLKGALE